MIAIAVACFPNFGLLKAETVNIEIPPFINSAEVLDTEQWTAHNIQGPKNNWMSSTRSDNSKGISVRCASVGWGEKALEDWLISNSAFKFEANTTYNLSIDVYTDENVTQNEQTCFTIMLSNTGNNPSNFSKEKNVWQWITPDNNNSGNARLGHWYIGQTSTFTVEQTGEYYIAILVDLASTDHNNVGIKDLKISYEKADEGNAGDSGEGEENAGDSIYPAEDSDNVEKTIPFLEDIYNSSDYAFNSGWRIYEGEGKGKWTGYASQRGAQFNTNQETNNFGRLVSPRFALKQGVKYTISFDTQTGLNYAEKLTFHKIVSRTQPGAGTVELKDMPSLKSAKANTWETHTIEYTPEADENVWFGFLCTSPANSDHIYLRKFVVTASMQVQADDNHGYTILTDGIHDAEAFNDTDAVYYDATVARNGQLNAETNHFEVANPNALVIFHHEATYLTTNANAVTQKADKSLSAKQIKIDSAHPFHFGKDITAETVDFTREVAAGDEAPEYVTLVLPFELNNNGEGKIAMLRNLNAEGNVLHFVNNYEGKIPAYTPFLYHAGKEDITLNGQNITKASDASESTDNLVITTLANSAWRAAYTTEKMVIEDVAERFPNEAVYYISGGKFWKATKKLTLNPFRAFFLAPKDDVKRVGSQLNFLIDGDVPTGLEHLYGESDAAAENGEQYSLDGLRVGKEHQGIKIREGKKYLER